MRGAWMWPAFATLTIADGVLLHLLPFGGDGWDLVPCLIASGFANLVVVAAFAPAGGLLLRRRRPDLPRAIASNYAGTVMLGALAAAFLAGGLIHRPLVEEKDRDLRLQFSVAREYFAGQAPPQYRTRLDHIDTLKLESDLYRTCVPGDDPRRALCLIVDTSQSPPGIREDPGRETNSSFQGRFGAFRAR